MVVQSLSRDMDDDHLFFAQEQGRLGVLRGLRKVNVTNLYIWIKWVVLSLGPGGYDPPVLNGEGPCHKEYGEAL